MKLKEFILEKETNGINPFSINRLGQIIALVGKNGSGKTRIINIFEDYLNNTENIVHEIVKNERFVEVYNILLKYQFLNDDENFFNIDLPESAKKCLGIIIILQFVKNENLSKYLNLNLKNIEKTLDDVNYEEIKIRIEEYTFEDLDLKYFKNNLRIKLNENSFKSNKEEDKDVIQFEEMLELKINFSDPDILNKINNSFLTYFSSLATRIVDADLDRMDDEILDSNELIILNCINNQCKKLLGFEFNWFREKQEKQKEYFSINTIIKGNYKINGRVFDYLELSEGQKILFSLSILMALKKLNYINYDSELVLIIDEPENHLHPEAQIELINGLKEFINENGQLIIATHSLSILSYLKQYEIFYVDKGNLNIQSKNSPIASINSLIGCHIEKFKDFLVNIHNWSYFNFMSECFENPDIIESANSNDPQVEVFKKALSENATNILLDFGAGKGRVLNEIVKDETISKKFNYIALEIDETLHNELVQKGANKVYTEYKELPKNTFDCILLCNVLHELKIEELESILNTIIASLNEKGYLLIIEDLELPIGEKIDIHGFLIQNKKSLAKLFSLQENEISEFKPNDSRYSNRILCNLIFKEKINLVTINSILESFKEIKINSYNNLINLRKNSKNLLDDDKIIYGRKSGLYSQLYINSEISIDILSSIENEKFQKTNVNKDASQRFDEAYIRNQYVKTLADINYDIKKSNEINEINKTMQNLSQLKNKILK